MLSLRWRKVLRDVLSYKTRTLLVILSIAVGVTAIGIVVGTTRLIERDLPGAFAAINPALATLGLSDFDDSLVRAVRKAAGIAEADGARRFAATVQNRAGDWKEMRVLAIRRFDEQRLNIIQHESGQWPPAKGEILIERSSLALIDKQVGDTIRVRLNDGLERDLTIVGLTHDLNQVSATLSNRVFGYIDFATLEWFGFPPTYDRLNLRVSEKPTDRAHIEEVAKAIEERVERAGYTVRWTNVPEPGQHEFEQFLEPLTMILGSIGVLSLLLSAFLVTNLIAAILAQQTRQIGVMKTIGGRQRQIVGLYLATVLIFSLVAIGLAIPLSAVGAILLSRYIAGLMNFNIFSQPLSREVLALEIFAGVLVPQAAALWPVLRGTRITVREAISDYGVSGSSQPGWWDVLLQRLRGISRPQLLSLRNTFRRKGRLLLTVITLTLASAIFISVFSVRASLLKTLEDTLGYWNYDISLDFARSHRTDFLVSAALATPGVQVAEAWGFWGSFRHRPDNTQGGDLLIIAPPIPTALLNPILLDGRWLLPTDENAVVINTDLLRNEPDLHIGRELVLEINGKKKSFQVVGLVRGVLAGPFAYVNYPYFARITATVGKASTLNIRLDQPDEHYARTLAETLNGQFVAQGADVVNTDLTAEERRVTINQFNILITILSTMALLLAVVGGLGLMGTMSINVIERRREIGVMRAIGASTGSILGIVLLEGSVIGALSWLIGTGVAIPLSQLMSDAVGQGFIRSELSFQFSSGGALAWLAVLLAISALASLIPARSAARVTVREAVAYE